LFAEKYNFSIFPVQPVGENNGNSCLFGIIDGKKEETFFCIIFERKICVKIIPKVEKRTTQLENMCYNIVGKKRKGVLCSECKYSCLKVISSSALTAWGRKKFIVNLYTIGGH